MKIETKKVVDCYDLPEELRDLLPTIYDLSQNMFLTWYVGEGDNKQIDDWMLQHDNVELYDEVIIHYWW